MQSVVQSSNYSRLPKTHVGLTKITSPRISRQKNSNPGNLEIISTLYIKKTASNSQIVADNDVYKHV